MAKRNQSGPRNRKDALARLQLHYQHSAPDDELEPRDLLADMRKEPEITSKVTLLDGGIPRAIAALRTSDEDDAQTFLDLWDTFNVSVQSRLHLEEVAVACELGTRRVFEMIVGAVLECAADATKLMLAAAMPKVTAVSIKQALTPKGIADRELVMKATGVLPTPKSANVTFNNAVQARVETTDTSELHPPTAVPIFDQGERLRMIHAAMGGDKRLPSPTHHPHDAPLPHTIDALQQTAAEVLAAESKR